MCMSKAFSLFFSGSIQQWSASKFYIRMFTRYLYIACLIIVRVLKDDATCSVRKQDFLLMLVSSAKHWTVSLAWNEWKCVTNIDNSVRILQLHILSPVRFKSRFLITLSFLCLWFQVSQDKILKCKIAIQWIIFCHLKLRHRC